MTRNATARLAGLLYLAAVPIGAFGYGYVAFMPKDDPATLLAALVAGRQVLGWSVLLDAAPTQLPPDAMSLLRREEILFQLATIFWGLWMLPLGWLAWRSGMVPKLIGIGLILGGVGYVTGFVLPVLGVAAGAAGVALAAVTVATEFAFMFCLIVKGAGTMGEERAHTAA